MNGDDVIIDVLIITHIGAFSYVTGALLIIFTIVIIVIIITIVDMSIFWLF